MNVILKWLVRLLGVFAVLLVCGLMVAWYLVSRSLPDYAGMSPEMLLKKIVKLEKQMYQHARDLEFEEAAKVRDEIDAMRRVGLGFGDSKAG